MTTLTDTQVITASGGLVELGYLSYGAGNVVVTAGTNSYIGGTLTCVCDGSPILVETYVPRVDMAATADQWIQVEMDGVSQGRVVAGYNPGTQQTAGPTHGRLRVTPSAGSHTFRMRAYSNNATTTYLSGGVFPDAFLRVSKIVQATQWPAVTTGTIICTSSTRPASPFAGQRIYETDTKKEWVYDGAAWYSPGLQGRATDTTASQSVTASTADISGLSVTWTAVSSRVYRTNLYVPNGYPSIASYPAVQITDGSNNLRQTGAFLLQAGYEAFWNVSLIESGLSGSQTRKGRFTVGSGTFTIRHNAGYPAFITVEDIGPA